MKERPEKIGEIEDQSRFDPMQELYRENLAMYQRGRNEATVLVGGDVCEMELCRNIFYLDGFGKVLIETINQRSIMAKVAKEGRGQLEERRGEEKIMEVLSNKQLVCWAWLPLLEDEYESMFLKISCQISTSQDPVVKIADCMERLGYGIRFNREKNSAGREDCRLKFMKRI